MAAQLPDLILFHGEQMELYSNPLEPYWIKHHKKRPAFQPKANCTRGYIATWEFRENQLWLKSIDGMAEQNHLLFWKKITPYALDMLFKYADDGVLALGLLARSEYRKAKEHGMCITIMIHVLSGKLSSPSVKD
jgi:hypothetical protein